MPVLFGHLDMTSTIPGPLPVPMAHATPEKVVPKSTPMTIFLDTEDVMVQPECGVVGELFR